VFLTASLNELQNGRKTAILLVELKKGKSINETQQKRELCQVQELTYLNRQDTKKKKFCPMLSLDCKLLYLFMYLLLTY
jgi:hypothetical protein